MKAILISIQPRWVAKILNGEKTLEIRKTMPKCDLPIDVYIYCTKDKPYIGIIPNGYFITDNLNRVSLLETLNGKVIKKPSAKIGQKLLFFLFFPLEGKA